MPTFQAAAAGASSRTASRKAARHRCPEVEGRTPDGSRHHARVSWRHQNPAPRQTQSSSTGGLQCIWKLSVSVVRGAASISAGASWSAPGPWRSSWPPPPKAAEDCRTPRRGRAHRAFIASRDRQPGACTRRPRMVQPFSICGARRVRPPPRSSGAAGRTSRSAGPRRRPRRRGDAAAGRNDTAALRGRTRRVRPVSCHLRRPKPDGHASAAGAGRSGRLACATTDE